MPLLAPINERSVPESNAMAQGREGAIIFSSLCQIPASPPDRPEMHRVWKEWLVALDAFLKGE